MVGASGSERPRVGTEVTLPGETPRSDRRAATEAWVLASLPRAMAYASSLLRDRSIAEDVVHDCYVRLLRKADVYDLPGDGTKILFRAITHACVDRNYRDRRHLSLEIEAGETTPGADSKACSPHDEATARELEGAVEEGLGRLSVAQRAALEMKSLGYSLGEIGEALGASPSHAGVLVHRARKALAAHLAPFMEARPDE